MPDSKQRQRTVHMEQQAKNVTIRKHSLHRKYVYSEGEQAHASSPGKWHTYHQRQVPALVPTIRKNLVTEDSQIQILKTHDKIMDNLYIGNL